MKQYTDGKRTIYATDKAYEVLYKQKGFRPLEEVLAQAKELAEAKAAEEARARAEAEAKAAEEAARAASEKPISQKLSANVTVDTAGVQQLLETMQEDMLPPLEEALTEGEPGEPIDLESLTVKELQEIAQEYGIDGYSRMKKAELIAALEGGGADAGEA